MAKKNYLVSARKYRPQTFSEIVGQEHVSETLMNALSGGRLAHAYLFAGPRGVGKTTAARILAKAINCQTLPAERTRNAEPCNECESCSSFTEGRNLNVVEIDAASNNSVADIRDLRDTVRIPPQGADKKVYIIDEVHMLSTQAFNAFLKTLEEPPPYALFIFATTDPHKVLPTILSRCQRFDFRRVVTTDIVEHLKYVSAEENVTADDDALLLIASKGDGALRDALSVFDQAVAMCGKEITYPALANALRIVDTDLFFAASDVARDGDVGSAIEIVDKLVASGFDLREFLVGLSMHFRNLLIANTLTDDRLLEVSARLKERYRTEAGSFSQSEIMRMLMICSRTMDALRHNSQPRLTLELGMIKMANLRNMIDLSETLGRISELEKKSRQKRDVQPRRVKEDAVVPPDASPMPEEAPPERSEPTDLKPAGSVPKKTKTADVPPPATTPPPSPATSTASTLFGAPALQRKRPSEGNGPEALSAESSAAIAVEVAPGSAPTEVERVWLRFVAAVKELRIHVGAILQHGAPLDLANGTLRVAVPDEFHKRLLTNQKEFLLRHLNEILHEPVKKLRFSVEPDLSGDGPVQPDFDPVEYMNQKRKENPVIKAIFDEFGGELVW